MTHGAAYTVFQASAHIRFCRALAGLTQGNPYRAFAGQSYNIKSCFVAFWCRLAQTHTWQLPSRHEPVLTMSAAMPGPVLPGVLEAESENLVI